MRELVRAGTVTSGSIIVPGPWFPAVATLADESPELDLGVHLTLTSESSAVRWAPLSTTSRASGLMDEDGYFWKTVHEVRTNAHPEAVAIELREQVTRAHSAGIRVSHLDHHMGAALFPEFARTTIAVAHEFGLPLLFPREIVSYFDLLGKGEVDVEVLETIRDDLEAAGEIWFDRFEMGLEREGSTLDAYRQLIGEIGDGVTFLSLHCTAPGDIDLIHPKDYQRRIEEYELFGDRDFLDWIIGRGFTLVDFGDLPGTILEV